MARHHAEVDELRGHPDGPQRLAVLPQLVAVALEDVCGRGALHVALERVEDREVEEGVAARAAAAAVRA